MSVFFVYQGFAKAHALGARIRRAGIRSVFEESGTKCSQILLPRRNKPLAEIFSVHSSRVWADPEFLSHARTGDVIFLEGLPAAVSCIRRLRKITNAKIHVDICDSWIRLGGVGAGAGSSLKARFLRQLKRLLAAMMLRYVSRHADSVSYISAADLAADDRFLHQRTKRFLVPNGDPNGQANARVRWRRQGPMVVVGDWSYPPNKQMLEEVVRWYSCESKNTTMPPLHVVGPNLGDEVLIDHPSIRVIGWVPDIASAYAEVSCALALTRSGAGVKNKVLEPLSFGIPVIATADALNGIAADPVMVLRYKDGLSADETLAWLDEVAEHGPRFLRPPTWQQCLEPLSSYMVGAGRP